ncbi:MAG: hypothetical protein MUE44_23540 [Oscillatoriaceae cyanobacterium Prado104]|nr:hypothetical protein [Oscillatoriaceae cyanobacterium Prado104]
MSVSHTYYGVKNRDRMLGRAMEPDGVRGPGRCPMGDRSGKSIWSINS